MRHEKDDIIELGGDLQVAIKYENLLAKIASSIYIESASQTSTCAWCVYFEDIEQDYGLEPGFIDDDVADDIETALYGFFGEFIASIEIVGEKEADTEREVNRYFDVTLYTNFCPGILEDDCSVEYRL